MYYKFSIFQCYRIYRTAILAPYVKVIDIPKGVRGEISIFSAFLTIYEGHRRYIQIVLYQGRYRAFNYGHMTNPCICFGLAQDVSTGF